MRLAFILAGSAASLAIAAPAHARTPNDYEVTVLVSNQAGVAPVTDPKLVNAWGIAASAASTWWVANNGSATATLYSGDGVKQSLEVEILGAPTGIVSNAGPAFELAPGKPAKFIFASEDGTLSAWNPGFDPTHAAVVHDHPGAVFKGLAIHGENLYATDFTGCAIEVLDAKFNEIDTIGGFRDRSISRSFCPFGIQAIGDSIFVTYALPNGEDQRNGVGLGFVREFDADGRLIARVASRGNLDAPWGLAMAPANFGRFSGCLLVGNFGNGLIHAYCLDDDGEFRPTGRLRDDGRDIVINGLWGIGFGNGRASGPTNVLYFSAGPDQEANGAFGKIEVGVAPSP